MTEKTPVTDTPSRFWTKLGAEHERLLAEHGVDRVKRTQALRYFTWRWRPSQLRQSEQLRFLLRHTTPAAFWSALTTAMPLDDDLWADSGFSRGERRATVIATRLLWAYAERHGARAVLDLPEPEIGAPLPIRFRGRLISQDLANGALEARGIERALQGRRPTRIVEVGGGYGRTAYTLLSQYPQATYTIIDIEPARTISQWYLSQLFGPERFRCLSPEQALELPEGSFDLAVSISSLQEMTPGQVADYLELFDRTARGGTVYLKQWVTWRNPDDEVELRFDDYPFPAAWQRTLYETAPVQTRFVQAGWRLPG